MSHRVMSNRLATHLRSLVLPAGLLALALLLVGSPLRAQQPDRRAPDRSLQAERLAPDRGEAQASPERGRTRTEEALTRRRAKQSAPASLTNTPADLFTRAGAGLTGVHQSSSTLGDVDGDGNLDLVITGEDQNRDRTSTLYLGDGSGGFSEADAGLTGVWTSSSTLGDVDGDGRLDLVLTGSEGYEDPSATLYLGDGNGGFSEANAGLTGVRYGSSTLGDVDGDEHLDLVITGEDQNEDPTTTVYLGDGSGGFSEANAGLTGVDDGSSTLGDVDGDGHLDLVITGQDQNGDPTTTLYLGDGSGGFGEADAGLTGVMYGSSTLGDVDGDGNPDLVITGNSDNGPTTTLYLGDGSGGFSEADAGLTGVEEGSSTVGDVDGDRDLDLVITGFSSGNDGTSTLYENLSN